MTAIIVTSICCLTVLLIVLFLCSTVTNLFVLSNTQKNEYYKALQAAMSQSTNSSTAINSALDSYLNAVKQRQKTGN